MSYLPSVSNLPWRGQLESPEPAVNRKPFSFKKAAKRLTIVVLIILLSGGGFIGWKFYENAARLAGSSNPFKLLSTFIPSTLSETNGRVNVLLAGYSADDPGHQGADLTDSIMILSINPTTKAAVVISVPRDLYVNIPGFGYSKINAAYEDGQSDSFSETGYPNGGMGLLEETLTEDFGVQFNYYALINYTAFQDAVNAVGGVSVNIQSPDARGLYDPNANLDLANGTVTLNGQEALNLARARGDGPGSYGFPDGDFNRTQHQQQILLALKDKASSVSVISNPLKIGGLADAIGTNIKTDLTIGDMETLYKDTTGISDANIQTITLNDYNNQDLLTDYMTSDGEDALVPAAGLNNYSQIQSIVDSVTGAASSTSDSQD